MMPDETEEIENPFPWLPLTVGDVVIVAWDGYSYVDEAGRTHWSGAAEPSEADAADAVGNPRTPPAPVPQIISRAEFIIALRRVLGLVEADIFAILSGMPAGEEQETARDLFEHAREFHRSNSILNALAASEGITSAQLDEVFRVGGALELD